MAERNEGYFLTADSDPQNLHATGLSFAEVEQTLSGRLKASLVVFTADACHAGQLGWTTYQSGNTGKTSEALEGIAPRDRAILKLLSARPTEWSYEDAKWDVGHGVFTYSLLQALKGGADKDGDRFVRAAEVIDFVSQRVAAETATKQNPRVAGSFDARLPLAVLPGEAKSVPAMLSALPVSLEVCGPVGTAFYVDCVFRGSLPIGGMLRLDGLTAGLHSITAEFPAAPTLEGSIRLATNSRLDLVPPAAQSFDQ
ncbi:MAG: hypothetical protein FJW36_23725 [Acidobacteria bacterium]|nr:hypothetical protein [Acidobacteriota bacterium]